MTSYGRAIKGGGRVLGVGRTTIDILQLIDRYPDEDSDNEIIAEDMAIGGTCGRGILTAARLGFLGTVTGMIGRGIFATITREHLQREHLTDCLVEDETASSSQHSFILSANKTRTRTTFSQPQPLADQRAIDIIKSHIHSVDGILLDCTDIRLARETARYCRELGKTSVLDTGSLLKPGVEKLLKLVTCAVVPERFLRAATRSEGTGNLATVAHEYLMSNSLDSLIVTMGPAGGLVITKDLSMHYAGFEIETKDACGAGDSFRGGLLVAILEGWDIHSGVEFAAWVAAQQCAYPGNIGLPTRSKANSWLACRS